MRAVGSSGAGGRAPSLRCHHMRAPRSALPRSAPVVKFKQSAECGLFEGHVVSGFIGHAACAPPKKSFPDQLKNILFSFSFKITSMLKKWRAVAITGGQILHAVRTANLKK